MQALENMKRRLQYNGGGKQQSRMIKDKDRSLRKGLLDSYQADTMIIENPDYIDNSSNDESQTLEFRCLINPDKTTFNEDKKMLSVPFEDICLNKPKIGTMSEGRVKIPIKCGTTFIWKETGTRWLITLRYLTELAYFRADIRKCYPYPLEIEGVQYWFSSVGENQETLDWIRKNKEVYNQLNYTRVIYIKRDEKTFNAFKRFKIIKLPNIEGTLEPWEVQAVNPNSVEDILEVHVKEYFNNQFEDISAQEQQKIQDNYDKYEDLVVYPYDRFAVRTLYIPDALWEVRNKTSGINLKIEDAVVSENETIATFQLLNGKTGDLDIFYGNQKIKHIIIKSM